MWEREWPRGSGMGGHGRAWEAVTSAASMTATVSKQSKSRMIFAPNWATGTQLGCLDVRAYGARDSISRRANAKTHLGGGGQERELVFLDVSLTELETAFPGGPTPSAPQPRAATCRSP